VAVPRDGDVDRDVGPLGREPLAPLSGPGRRLGDDVVPPDRTRAERRRVEVRVERVRDGDLGGGEGGLRVVLEPDRVAERMGRGEVGRLGRSRRADDVVVVVSPGPRTGTRTGK
jgi:hypothetical protein